eukprot:8676967-Ditylum_brightwellii.AAC.1
MENIGTTYTIIDPIRMLENQEDTTQSDETEDTAHNYNKDEGTPTTEDQKAFPTGLPLSPPELPTFPEDFIMPSTVVINNPLVKSPKSQPQNLSKEHTDKEHSDDPSAVVITNPPKNLNE